MLPRSMSCVGTAFRPPPRPGPRRTRPERRCAASDAGLGVDQVQVPLGKLGGQIFVGFDPLGQMNRDRTDGCVFHRKRILVEGGTGPDGRDRKEDPLSPGHPLQTP